MVCPAHCLCYPQHYLEVTSPPPTPTTYPVRPQVLSWLSFGDCTVRSKLASQAKILGVYYVCTYAILSANKPRFQPMRPTVVVVEEEEQQQLGEEAGAAPAAQ